MPDRYQALVDGTLKVEDLTDEELLRGMMADKRGGFSGAPPKVIPRAMYQAAIKELIGRKENGLLADLEDMYDVLREVAQSPRAQAAARVQAAIYLIERVSGKITDKTELSVSIKKYEQLAESGDLIMDLDDIEDAEVVEETKAIEAKPAVRRTRVRKKTT